MKRVKITVLRKEFYPEYADAYLTEGREVGPCPMLEVGDTFVFEGGAQMPQGFCPWAWVDIYNSVSALAAGASYAPWNNREGQTIVCCTDGIRPVVFELHAMEEGE
ncbi:TIGR04076 family protein [Candidatus Allofournierella merdavium]|mgnify:FL=1|uniref:TIGR04076 family protein n=1 Tax=Candidatus Allofournierella merdavium TaxID=2838593 RepID=UPI00374F7C3F